MPSDDYELSNIVCFFMELPLISLSQGNLFSFLDIVQNCHASLDFVIICGGLTSCAFLDKKGLLSWPNATAEKVLCFEKNENARNGQCFSFFNTLEIN